MKIHYRIKDDDYDNMLNATGPNGGKYQYAFQSKGVKSV